MLATSKFNSTEILISQALIDMNISHEEFVTTFKEKDRYEKMKENIRDKKWTWKTRNHKNEQHKTKKLSVIKKIIFFFCINKNVWVNKKKLL